MTTTATGLPARLPDIGSGWGSPTPYAPEDPGADR